MRIKLLLLMLLLAIPLIYSDILIKNVKWAYNLGENVEPAADISLEEDFNGFQKAEMDCDSYSITYYISPLSLDMGQTINVKIPPMNTFSKMKGSCRIIIILESLDRTIIEEKESEEFEVSDALIALVEKDNLSLNPSDTFAVKGGLYNIREEPISGILKAAIYDQYFNFVVSNSSFDFDIQIPADIKSGKNKLLLSFEDNKENYVDKLLNLDIIPKASNISIQLNDDIYLPYEELRADIALLDQAGDVMDGELVIKLFRDKEELYSVEQSSGAFSYALDNALEPGDYSLSASYADLTAEGSFAIAALQQIESKVEDQKVVITNTGNVQYKNITSVIIVKEDGNIILRKKVSLKPDETYEIDLSKEVPEGRYSVILPKGEKVEQVHLDDNRNILKKTTSGLKKITGSFAKTVSNSKLGFTFLVSSLVIIVSLVIIQYFGLPVIPAIKEKVNFIYKKFKK